MKPVYLDMTYFGPHEHSIIDFSKLESTPIFLISGDTGAGKSTIFDAMTFALFGTTTNDGTDGRAAKDMRSQFAPADQPTKVIFYFEQGNQLYKVSRTPEQSLAKKRGSGMTQRAATAKLAVVDRVGGVEINSIATKPADVGPEIGQILNLTADQFKKIILLPQNDFSEFLKSKTDDKEKILKKIFGTQLYSDFSAALKTEYLAARKTGEQFITDLRVALSSTTWTDDEQAQLKATPDDQKVSLLTQFVATRQTRLEQAQQATEALDKTVKQAEAVNQAGRDRQQQFKRLADAQTEYQTQVQQPATEMTAMRQHIQALTWAEGLQSTAQDLLRRQQEHKQLSETQVRIATNVKQTEAKAKTAQAALKQLAAQGEDNQKQQQRITQLTTLIPQASRIESLTTQLATLTPEFNKLQQTKRQQQQQFTDLDEQIKAKQTELPDVEKLRATKDHLSQQRSTFIETLTPLDHQWHQAKKTAADANDLLTKHKTALTAAQQKFEAAQRSFAQQRGRRQELMIAQLQQELVDGEPCAVCGSTDHSHMVATISASETELRQSMTAVDDAQNAVASTQQAVKSAQQQVEAAQKSAEEAAAQVEVAANEIKTSYQQLVVSAGLESITTYNLKTITANFDTQLHEINQQLTAAQELSIAIDKLKTNRQALQDQVTATKLAVTQKQTQIDAKTTDLQHARTETQLKADETSQTLRHEKQQLEKAVADYQKEVDTAKDAVQASEVALSKDRMQQTDLAERLEMNQQATVELNQTLTTALSADDAPTHDTAVLNAWLTELSAGQLSKLQVTVAKYDETKSRLTCEIKELQAALANVEQPDLPTLQAQLEAQRQLRDQAIQQQTVAKQAFTDGDSCLQRVQKIMQQQGNFAKRFAEITGLYNIITGKDGNESKLKLETYVVQHYLQRVLNYANEHFINLLSNNRYTFELADEASDKRTDHGLDINVYDNETGNSRSSKTLSGGETFIAALSIALSLSEVVQSSANGVQIDALFVDEGFGSLDDETLEKAMQALETIGENRMVGVISHIESMKRTIGQQVLIKKLGDGRSTVRLISK
ncbi:AAA family ATPase [Lactiplantibacillus pentosus]|uniref:AAA family ATPase n=1 Tax=Lactiplantibacillus pentosus TaxID=1589 RepID=UPI0021A6D3EC|nr:SMC family ATPase [Lactiplantibacillus pentosus]MCT3307313.1 SMC family ATPase [Lactiplantibacillus pentosus]